MTDTPKFVFLRESITKSLIRDTLSYGMLASMIAVGWFIDSDAMQWVGGIIWMLCVLGRAKRLADDSTKSPQDAANWLRDEFGVIAEDRR